MFVESESMSEEHQQDDERNDDNDDVNDKGNQIKRNEHAQRITMGHPLSTDTKNQNCPNIPYPYRKKFRRTKSGKNLTCCRKFCPAEKC